VGFVTERRPYHHGDLRRAILSAAVDVIGTQGPTAVSLRDLARRAGVSHAAPAHHFKDRAGLLTVIATEGYQLLADALARRDEAVPDLRELGVRYVRFGIEHPAHFEVMFRPELVHTDDPELVAAQDRAGAALRSAVTGVPAERRGGDVELARLAAWSLVHGFVTLWLGGNLAVDDPETAFQSIAKMLFPDTQRV
jgi:AcrR family transcriptional regulator